MQTRRRAPRSAPLLRDLCAKTDMNLPPFLPAYDSWLVVGWLVVGWLVVGWLVVGGSAGPAARRIMLVKAALTIAGLFALSASALAQQPDGAAVFKRACANCHADNQTTAPTPTILR